VSRAAARSRASAWQSRRYCAERTVNFLPAHSMRFLTDSTRVVIVRAKGKQFILQQKERSAIANNAKHRSAWPALRSNLGRPLWCLPNWRTRWRLENECSLASEHKRGWHVTMTKGWEFYWEGRRYCVGASDAPTARRYLRAKHLNVAQRARCPKEL